MQDQGIQRLEHPLGIEQRALHELVGIAHLSEFMMLDPGDVVTTGTPPGVGAGRKPPSFLKGGETLRLVVSGLGEQTQKVVRYKG